MSVRYRLRLYGQQAPAPPVSGQFNATIALTVPFSSGRLVVAGTPPYMYFSTTSPTTDIVIANVGNYLVNWHVTGATTLTNMSVTAVNCAVTLIQTTVINGAATAGTVGYELVVSNVDQLALPTLTFILAGSAGAGSNSVRISSYNTDLN